VLQLVQYHSPLQYFIDRKYSEKNEPIPNRKTGNKKPNRTKPHSEPNRGFLLKPYTEFRPKMKNNFRTPHSSDGIFVTLISLGSIDEMNVLPTSDIAHTK
jgi:hypothetical protein